MAIGTKQHEVLDLGVAALLCAVNDIVKPRLTFPGNFQANGERVAGCSASIGFFFRQIAKGIAALVHSFSGVGARSLGDSLFHGLVVALFFRSEVAICLALFEQTACCGAVLRRVCRLKDEILVVFESEPLESSDN